MHRTIANGAGFGARPLSLDGLMPLRGRDFERPGRSEALGTHCMAATSHPLATWTALQTLSEGGNAVDAAVAAAALLSVVEPTQTGIGGDCFVLYMPRGTGTVHALNGSGWAPRASNTDWFLERGITAIDTASPHSVTVPGAVAAWERLALDYGSFGFDRLLAPAIRAADEGYAVTERLARDWERQTGKLAASPEAANVFLRDGMAPAAGTVHHQPRLAQALRSIAERGAAAYYSGWIAEDIVDCLRSRGGLHTLEDFAEFAPEYVSPMRAAYRGYDIWECPPNGQGVTPLIMARMLENFAIGALEFSGASRLHLLAEIARLGYAVRDAVVGDPRAAPVPVDEILSDSYTSKLAQRYSASSRMADLAPPFGPNHRDTVFLTVVDRDQNVIAFINSIFDDFGSGIVTPAAGILLHNRGCGFVIERDHPNTIAARKRPLHTIMPALLTRGGRAAMSFGVTGGHFQPMGQILLLSNLIDHGMSLQQAIDQPRFFARGDAFEVEQAIPRKTIEKLQALGHPVVAAENPLGTAQAIRIDWESGVLHGAADGRRDGVALGW